MRDSTGKSFPIEYRDIIERYYRKLSELHPNPEAGPRD